MRLPSVIGKQRAFLLQLWRALTIGPVRALLIASPTTSQTRGNQARHFWINLHDWLMRDGFEAVSVDRQHAVPPMLRMAFVVAIAACSAFHRGGG